MDLEIWEMRIYICGGNPGEIADPIFFQFKNFSMNVPLVLVGQCSYSYFVYRALYFILLYYIFELWIVFLSCIAFCPSIL